MTPKVRKRWPLESAARQAIARWPLACAVFTAAGVLAAALLPWTPAHASTDWQHPELDRARSELRDARGPEVYTALRGIWRTWDRADPLHVEQTLAAASRDERLEPAAREYAAMLVAYARKRRGDANSARSMIKSLGFVSQWLVVGPFDNEGKTGLGQPFEPEKALTEAIVPGRAFTGKERPVRWRTVPEAFPYGWVALGSLLRPESRVCAYLSTFVESTQQDREPRPVSLWVGVGGAFKLFWNGEPILEDDAYRNHDVDRQAVQALLYPGLNSLTLKVCGDDAAPQVSVRIRHGRGFGDAGVQFAATPEASVRAAEAAAARAADRSNRVTATPGSVRGPLQRFESLVARAPSPGALEAFAKYLVETHSDDVVRHRARDLATQAAEKGPTADRLLLAAKLAEDQNATRGWLDRTEKLLGSSAADHVKLLLAKASLLRRSPKWREALPLYQRALVLNADCIEAIEGVVALYNQVELQRTALEELRTALNRHPNSVNLLNLYASQLRKLGRTVEAIEAESRYSALRFDDQGYLAGQAQLAVARRDPTSAEHWLSRLADNAPESLSALTFASRLERGLGHPKRAVASLERALELAPEDVGTLRTLADLKGELGERGAQLRLLERVLAVRPQDAEVREYVEHLRPAMARSDEKFAWSPKRFLRDRSAPANGYNQRTLRQLTVTTVYENGLASRFRQVVFQPLTDTAAALARQYSFQYQADSEVVQLRGAKVYRADGRIDEAIEYGEGAADNPDISMYTSARTFYVQFPRLEPGDVVELRYRVDDISRQNDLADYFGEVVYMQSSEPVANAEYVLITPKSRALAVDTHVPRLETSTTDKGNTRIRRYFAKSIPALVSEPEMPPWPEMLSFIHVSTYKDWRALGRWYWGLVKDQFELDAETRALAHRLADGKGTELEKVKAVYGWVVQNIRYVALEFGVYGYKPRRSVQTVARGWGDCKDRATVIVSLLAELGIESTPVILRTQMRGGFPSRIPSLEPFDHAIVYVPSLDLYLDGTAEHTGALELPEMDQGALGLLVQRGNSKLVELPTTSKEPNLVQRVVNAQLRRNGSAAVQVDYEVRGSSASTWRRKYAAESTRRERVSEALSTDWPDFRIEPGVRGLTINDLTDIEQPVSLQVRGTAGEFARREGRALSMEVTPSFRLTPAFASLKERRSPVRVLGLPRFAHTVKVEVPPVMRVTELPRAMEARTAFGTYFIRAKESGGTITVESELVLTKTTIPPAEYDAFKKFCAEVDEAFSQRLVVE